MTKTEFAGFIREHGPVILDGATGTNLMEAGMPIGVCPESWVLENPQVLLDARNGLPRNGRAKDTRCGVIAV